MYIYIYVQISHASQHHFAHTHTEIWHNTVDGLDIQPTSTSWHGESPMFALLFDIYVCLSICSIQGEYFLKVFFSRSFETLTGSIEASSHVKQLKISGIFTPKTLQVCLDPTLRAAPCPTTSCVPMRPPRGSLRWTCRCCGSWWCTAGPSPFAWRYRRRPMETGVQTNQLEQMTQLTNGYLLFFGCFLKWWVSPKTMGFSY